MKKRFRLKMLKIKENFRLSLQFVMSQREILVRAGVSKSVVQNALTKLKF